MFELAEYRAPLPVPMKQGPEGVEAPIPSDLANTNCLARFRGGTVQWTHGAIVTPGEDVRASIGIAVNLSGVRLMTYLPECSIAGFSESPGRQRDRVSRGIVGCGRPPSQGATA
jgi:hypothetical protein